MTDIFSKLNPELPLIPLKDTVIFPGTVSSLFIGRVCSITAANLSHNEFGNQVLISTQKNMELELPKASDLYNVGVLAKIIQTVKLPDGNYKVLAEAINRVKLRNITFKNREYFTAGYTIIPDNVIENVEEVTEQLEEVTGIFNEYIRSNKKLAPDILAVIGENRNPAHISNVLASHLTCKVSSKQELLEASNISERLDLLIAIIESEINHIGAEQQLDLQVKKQIQKTQRDFYLNEQMKAIQKELGDTDEKTETSEFERLVKKVKLSKEAKEKAESELKKLKSMNPAVAEASVIRNYLDILLTLPWGVKDKSDINIRKAKQVLDDDHYGIEKIKERIIEYLAIQQRAKKVKGPIICFVGPPGVGKTSLVKSIANALGRKFSKFSLGGVRDEAEIRGHRRTYLGSMPGKILSLLKKAKTSNPVMLLDEIDKISSDYRGDPTSALLEVLDPEQNNKFMDHYLDLEYDLSDVMFIATANNLNLPRPLLDRMEIIRIPGYIESEKMQIAKRHLIPKQRKVHELKESEWEVSDDAILDIIRYYTKEAGVRSLERQIGTLARKSLTKILQDPAVKSVKVEASNLKDFLGVQKYDYGLKEDEDQIGVTIGLAYTEVGGELLAIEALTTPGDGKIKLTGKLGEVMQESAQAAFTYFKSKIEEFGLTPEDYKNKDIHIHVPEGATPKDGPSAGITLFTTIVSVMTGIPVRNDVAMTGEITLRGRVLPIGGLKEKLLAAVRGGIKKVVISKENMKDLEEVPEEILSKISIAPVGNAIEVLDIALKDFSKASLKIRVNKFTPNEQNIPQVELVTH